MQTNTGKIPSEWLAIHEEELAMLAVEGDLGSYDLPTIRAIEAEAAAIRYWSFVRSRIRSGGKTPTDYEEEARRVWRRAVAVAARYGVRDPLWGTDVQACRSESEGYLRNRVGEGL